MTAEAAGAAGASDLRCPMRECRRRIDIDALPLPSERPSPAPCLHFIAGWGGRLGQRAEAVLWGLAGNREFAIRNLRPAEVRPDRIALVRAALDEASTRFAHPVERGDGTGALFGDQHERNRVAFEYAVTILGPDPSVPASSGGFL